MVLAMMENGSGNTYEDARKQRLLENKKRFEVITTYFCLCNNDMGMSEES